jgi:hypothetical protein
MFLEDGHGGGCLGENDPGASFVTTAFAWRWFFLASLFNTGV